MCLPVFVTSTYALYDLDANVTYGSNSYIVNNKPDNFVNSIFPLKTSLWFRRQTLTWIIINSILSVIVSGLIIYNNHLQKNTHKMLDEAQEMIRKYLNEIEESFEKQERINNAQSNFNESVTTNFIRHEDALKIIVNYIRDAK